ncbi:Gp52 [Mycolicibacterium canariasense]|uniref:Gp52 n=1 Tax=Mycolicibacterium canariasense TaxID=228230 RepID=A0A100WHX8_MYCCR|nr:hypothetical protein [Mycolicibacterium canariasense]MCV7210191.1 hypothetical protein [Mycolicibacterium canariasense]ORU98463.1 hypothetical protein AWB94_28375 [Mycolicibacterium canariasense]GAS98849.1 Gp52 [Mycolicibacterium canariasense]
MTTATTGLVWRPVGRNELLATAAGVRGWYRIRHVGAQWLLRAYGWDGLPSLLLPVGGKHFDTRQDAERAAHRIDTQPPCGEVSGS